MEHSVRESFMRSPSPPKAAVAEAVANGWTREQTMARVRFDNKFGPVDIGQGYMMDHIQTLNAASLWDKFTALGYARGR